MPSANAFTLFGVDFGNFFDKITFWNNNDKKENTQIQANNKTPSKQKKQQTPLNIQLGNQTYNEEEIKKAINDNNQAQEYIQKLEYECFYITINKTKDFTIEMNPQKGEVTNISSGKSCDTTIEIEESLITQIQEEGFNSSKTKDYIKKVDLPMGVYAKAAKVIALE